MRAVAVILALVAVACLVWVIADMATEHDDGRRCWVLRAFAVASFAAAVVLNVLAR